MSNDTAKLIASLVVGWLGVGWVLFVLLYMFMPLMLFFVMRHLKGIRRELSTLNETLQNKLIIR